MRDIGWVVRWLDEGVFPVRALLSLVGGSGHRQAPDFAFGLQRLCSVLDFTFFTFFMPFQARPWIAERRTTKNGLVRGVGGDVLRPCSPFVGVYTYVCVSV